LRGEEVPFPDSDYTALGLFCLETGNHKLPSVRLLGSLGSELAQKIKNDFSRVRIAMVTGYDLPEYRQAASQQGVDRLFVKDFLDWKEIKEFVQSTPKNNQ